MTANGNGKWTVWVAGILATVIITVLGFIGNGVIANENKRVMEDTRIRQEIDDKVQLVRVEQTHLSDNIEEKLGDIQVYVQSVDDKLDTIRKDQALIVEKAQLMQIELLKELRDIHREVRE